MIIIAIAALVLLNQSLEVTQSLIVFNMNTMLARHTLNKIYGSTANLLLANTAHMSLQVYESNRELALMKSGMDELGNINIVLDSIIKDSQLTSKIPVLADTNLISLNFSGGITKTFRLLESLNLVSSNILPFAIPGDIQPSNTNSQFLLVNPMNKLLSELSRTNTEVQTYASAVFSDVKLMTLLTSLVSVAVGLVAFVLSVFTTSKSYALLEEQTTIAYGFNGEDCALLRDNCEQILGVVTEARDRIAKQNQGSSNPGSNGIFGLGQEDGFRLDTNGDERGGEFIDESADAISRKKKGNLNRFAKYDMVVHLTYMTVSVILAWLIYLAMRSPFPDVIESHNLLHGIFDPPIELAGQANSIKAYLVNKQLGNTYQFKMVDPLTILSDRTKQGMRDKVTDLYRGLTSKQGYFQSAESETGDAGFINTITTGEVCAAFNQRRGKFIPAFINATLQCSDVLSTVQMDGGASKGLYAFVSAYSQWVSTLQSAVYLALNSGKETPITSLETCALTSPPSPAAFNLQLQCILSSKVYKSLGKHLPYQISLSVNSSQ